MENSKPQVPQPKVEELNAKMVPLDAVAAMIAKAVAEAMAAKIHQHAEPELSGRTRADGKSVETPGEDNAKWSEVKYADNTVRRDYK